MSVRRVEGSQWGKEKVHTRKNAFARNEYMKMMLQIVRPNPRSPTVSVRITLNYDQALVSKITKNKEARKDGNEEIRESR